MREEQIRNLAKLIVQNPKFYTEDVVFRAIMDLKVLALPKPSKLSVAEFNWLVDYINEARPIVKLINETQIEKL